MGNTAHFTLKVFDTIKGAFAYTAGIGAGDKTRFPPHDGVFIEEVVDHAVYERSGEDFAGNWVVDNESDATARLVFTGEDSIA